MKHILLVEPNTVLAQTYTQALEHAGYTVARAAGAQTAVDAVDSHRPDVVILELQLRGHGGIEFLHEFRSYPEWQDVPVVVNTLLAPVHLKLAQDVLYNELGVRQILYKPRTTLQDLIRAIRAI